MQLAMKPAGFKLTAATMQRKPNVNITSHNCRQRIGIADDS